jgi:hypothetical protein
MDNGLLGCVNRSCLTPLTISKLGTVNVYQSWAQLPLSVDKSVNVNGLINGTALIFHFGNVNLTEERLFLNLNKASALKIQFCRILKT